MEHGIWQFPQKVQSCHHANPSKAMQKIGWAAQLDGPGPKASVPLGSVHAWLEWDAFCIHILHTNAYHTFCGKKGP